MKNTKRENKDFVEMMLKKANSTEENRPNKSSDANLQEVEELTKRLVHGKSIREPKAKV
ncbi:hypothetical protein J4413_04205 [Candidatus Woesearchaeota archaeon]|nr:hypothetical protein [Candidatus Woesearchaeota archaeon]